MKLQHWGTFSVKDHVKARAFVAEVLLFDRLVIPRPITQQELKVELQGGGPGDDEVDRWRKNSWYPERQRELLDILGEYELAIELPWGRRAEAQWKAVYETPDEDPIESKRSALAQAVQNQVELAKWQSPDDAAFIATGGVLALYVAGEMQNEVARKIVNRVKAPDAQIEPVIAYGSYGEFASDQGVLVVPERPPSSKAAVPYALFEWEFFVPEDSTKSDAELLRQAAKLASKSDFCEARQRFHGWLKQMYGGEVDSQDARERMLKMLDEYTGMIRKSGLKTAIRYAAKAAAVLAPLAGLADHRAGVDAGVVAGGVALAVEWLLPKPEMPSRLLDAALLHDGRRHFGRH